MISQTETAGGAAQYGFYAVPKAVEPKKKYRDNIEDEQQEEEELEDLNPYATIDDREASNQRELERDYYVDEAPYPEFKPRERGLDYGVQIERGDLFDFPLEVRPLIEILVGRSVVSALNELHEEKQKEERTTNLDKYQKKRNAELMVTQRLEAKHKRKLEQADRRRLQKGIYVKNQKEAGKKLIARRNAKESLLGFKAELFNELEDAGYLRSEHISDLKIQYEEWLYEEIMESLAFQSESESAAHKIIWEDEKRITEEHRKAIDQEMAKRKIVLDEREKARRESEERKEKKRYKKMREKLNAQRQPDFLRFENAMDRFEQVASILKFADRSNGFSRNYNGRQTVYIAGGLENFLLALLESSGRDLTVQEIEVLIMKIISGSGREIEISLLGNNYEKIEEAKKRMEENKVQFMTEKSEEVRAIAQQISLDLSLLQKTNTPIKQALHNRFIEALLSIYLTIQPEKNEENPYELDDNEKKRLQFADKIVFTRQTESFVQRLQNVNENFRVHFEVLQSAIQSQASQKKVAPAEEEKEQEEWIDIYDGEGWERLKKTAKRQVSRGDQMAAAYALGSFDNSFVIDERVFHYLQVEIEKLIDVIGGEKFKQYCENLGNIKLKMDLPVFDGQIRWI